MDRLIPEYIIAKRHRVEVGDVYETYRLNDHYVHVGEIDGNTIRFSTFHYVTWNGQNKIENVQSHETHIEDFLDNFGGNRCIGQHFSRVVRA